MEQFRCKVCGEVFEAPNHAEAVCPVCGVSGEDIESIQSAHQNKYAGTKTERNLEAAFAGESQARNKYTFFAAKAEQDGFEQIARIFSITADNEKEHAEIWFKELGGIGTKSRPARLPGARGELPPWRRDRKKSRRTLPRTSEKCRYAGGFQKKRGQGLGVRKLRSYRRGNKRAEILSRLRKTAGLF